MREIVKMKNEILETLQKMPKTMERDFWLMAVTRPTLSKKYATMTLEQVFGKKSAKIMKTIVKFIDSGKATAEQFKSGQVELDKKYQLHFNWK